MELQTERLSLRPMSDAELQTLMEAVRPRDAELADAYNDMLRGSREHPQARLWYTAWGAYRKVTGELVGDLCFKGPSAQPEIGYGMIEAFWGRGYATESAGGHVPLGTGAARRHRRRGGDRAGQRRLHPRAHQARLPADRNARGGGPALSAEKISGYPLTLTSCQAVCCF